MQLNIPPSCDWVGGAHKRHVVERARVPFKSADVVGRKGKRAFTDESAVMLDGFSSLSTCCRRARAWNGRSTG